jgi:succinoglycan biosynthesis protein ExoM
MEAITPASSAACESAGRTHISVCICTYQRPEYLARLLDKLSGQDTQGLFTYSIVVADNDRLRSAESVAGDFAARSAVQLTYCVEPQPGIPFARNRVVANATGDYLAFIDDDEFPGQDWLLTLLQACREYNVDGVLGPVKPYFQQTPPRWLLKSKLYDRRTYSTGTPVDWRNSRTGNVLIKRKVVKTCPQPFRPQFARGEDVDFFRRMIAVGFRFVWCDEAVAYEEVPPARWQRAEILRRAWQRGRCAALQPVGARGVGKSLVAIFVYTAALPFALVMGQHRFMQLMVKLCDHAAKLGALVRRRRAVADILG